MKWTIPESDAGGTAGLARALGIAVPAARVLWARGYRSVEQAQRFLEPSIADLNDPALLKDMPAAVARLRRAIEQKERILLYGDYDVDGTSAVVILKKGLELLGAKVSFHVPHRLKDGYGMRSEVVEEAAAAGVSLIVSVDTGIRANEVVKHAAGLGIDVIVTDHHLPETELPPAVAVLNPNRPDCGYPEKNLCGAGVALKLMDALIRDFGWEQGRRERLIDSLLKLVAIATVADVVPLTGENRVIVKRGLAGLDRVRNPGLRALLDVSGFPEGESPSARQVAFQVAPRINAAGRMASAADVIEMFLTEDGEVARTLAAKLHELNSDRRDTEADIARAIFEQCVGAAGDGRRCRAGVRGGRLASGRGGDRREPRGGAVPPPCFCAGHRRGPGAGLGAQHTGISPARSLGGNAGFVRQIWRASAGCGHDHGRRQSRRISRAAARLRGRAAHARRLRARAGY